MKTVLVLLTLFFLVGCTSTSIVRVVETGGGGAVGVFTGDVGSCAVHQTKGTEVFADVKLLYKGKNCLVTIETKTNK